MTKKEMFESIKEAVSTNDEMVEFINNEIALIDKRKNYVRKPTAHQIENQGFSDKILAYLNTVDSTTVSDASKAMGISPQRATAIFTKLLKSNLVKREYNKKTPFYSKVED